MTKPHDEEEVKTLMTGAIPLPRNKEGELLASFPANGHTYHWLPSEAAGLKRWTQLSKMLDVLNGHMDSNQAVTNYFSENMREVLKTPWKDITDLQLHVVNKEQAYLDKIVSKSEARMHIAALACAYMVRRDDHDFRDCSPETIEGYCNDFIAEGYSAMDFFDLAGTFSEGFPQNFRLAQEKLQKRARQLMGDIDTKSEKTES